MIILVFAALIGITTATYNDKAGGEKTTQEIVNENKH